ncbi:MAG TPA: hypothetical protein PK397_13295, partial [Ignavibacteriaceae bacterium]|nr:hypothetical protein [Ignavibacteriaceae bacterium]
TFITAHTVFKNIFRCNIDNFYLVHMLLQVSKRLQLKLAIIYLLEKHSDVLSFHRIIRMLRQNNNEVKLEEFLLLFLFFIKLRLFKPDIAKELC